MIKFIVIFIILQLLLLLLLPSFFLYKKVVVKRFKLKKSNGLSILMTLIMPIIYTFFFVIICYGIINPIIRSQKFHKKEWILNPDSRYKMINDLMDNDLLIGKTKNEVIKILGKDFSENCWVKETWCYTAPDPDNYSPLDHYEFIIYFDNFGKVKKVAYMLI